MTMLGRVWLANDFCKRSFSSLEWVTSTLISSKRLLRIGSTVASWKVSFSISRQGAHHSAPKSITTGRWRSSAASSACSSSSVVSTLCHAPVGT